MGGRLSESSAPTLLQDIHQEKRAPLTTVIVLLSSRCLLAASNPLDGGIASLLQRNEGREERSCIHVEKIG